MFQSMWRSFHNLKDVGVVQVKVIRAEGLMAADVTGKTVALSPKHKDITSAVLMYIVKSIFHTSIHALIAIPPFLLLFCNCW